MPGRECTVQRIVTAEQQREGAGFLVRRPFPSVGLEQVDPFLMLDEVGPVRYGPGEAIGAPDHPHRGFETVSYIVAGEKLHEDSTGATQLIEAGDVQWMTAGSGIVHSELPGPGILRSGGLVHGFQIWVNLPAARKQASPGYQYLASRDIPRARGPGGADVVVIAGEAFGVQAVIGTHTPVWLQDWRLASGGAEEITLPPQFNAMAYVFEGTLSFGAESVSVTRGDLALFSPGDGIRVAASSDVSGRFLLLAGEPIGEPLARYGPFVMNTREELLTAFDDYQAGRMGRIRRN